MGELVTITVICKGQELDPKYELMYFEVVREVNRIPYARLELLDGDAATQEFALSDTDLFALGAEVEVKLRYEGDSTNEKTVFKGLVIKHALEVDASNSSLVIEMKDMAFRLCKGRKNKVFANMTDSAIIKSILTESTLTEGTIATTKSMHEKMVQYYCSDWDFIRSRADVNGLILITKDGEISAVEISTGAGDKWTLEYGIDAIYRFEMEANASNQYEDVQSQSWDIQSNTLSAVTKAKSFELKQGNFNSAEVAKATGGTRNALQSIVSTDAEETQAWADARMVKSRMAMLKGSIVIPGNADFQLGDTLEIKGMGERFNGTTLITGVRHEVSVNGWDTTVQFGLPAQWFSREDDIQDVPAAGLLPAVHGLQIGIIAPFETDETNQFRVKVKVPSIDPQSGLIWARLAAPDAGNKRGFFFRPEPGDEVILGFLNDDPRQAIILGGLYSSEKNLPPDGLEKLNAENDLKGLVTKGGIKILFNDIENEQSLTIQTSENNIITIDEKSKQIQIKDISGNEIILNPDGISLKSAKDFSVDAPGKVEIKGKEVNLK